MADENKKKTDKAEKQQGKKAKAKVADKPVAKYVAQVEQEKPVSKKERKPAGPRKLYPFEKNYLEKCIPALIEQHKYENKMRVPKLTKIVVNTCIKESLQDKKILETAANEIAAITGQKPVFTKSKKSIANFKLRAGALIGAQVTLRGVKMYEFMNRLVNIALPRVRDFKGVSSKSFDGRGNYTLGLTEQIIFPEIDFDKVSKVNGMNVTFVTTATTDEEGRTLLSLMGMPFKKA